MLRFLLLLVLCCLPQFSFAQDIDADNQIKPMSRHEIGFNATRLIAGLFASSDDLDDFGDYAFVYKFHTHSKGAFRIGIGGRFFDKNEVIDEEDSRNTKQVIANARFGYEFRKQVAPKWTFLFGADGIFSYQDITNRFESNIDITTSVENNLIYGGSPFMGMEYRINERIRLSTELAMLFSYISKEESDTFQNFPEFT